MLGKEIITDPACWQLIMELSDDSLQVMAFSPFEQHEMIYERIESPEPKLSRLRKLEDAVYDNPLLLSEFRRVTVLCDTTRFMALPDFAGSDNVSGVAAFRYLFPGGPDGARGEVLFSELPELNMSIAYEVDASVAGFLRRTFPCVRFEHPLVPLCRYFKSRHRGRSYGKTLVNINGRRLDIVTLGNNAPLMVNSFRFREPMDAVYYILSSRKSLKLADTDEIIIGGDRMTRAQMTPVLRRYVRYVMPAIFPSVMFRAGRASLSAPFEMILLPMVSDSLK